MFKEGGVTMIRSPKTSKGTKSQTMLYLPVVLVEKAKKLDINISLCATRALRKEVKRCASGICKQKKVTNAPVYTR